jgi:hypothetical protein
MPRPANETSVLLADLHARLGRVVEVARQAGHDTALEEIRRLVRGGSAGVPMRRGPGRPKGSRNKPKALAAAPKRPRRNSWAGLSKAARLKRINAIRKGKGLPLRSE